MITGVAMIIDARMFFASSPYRHHNLIKMAREDDWGDEPIQGTRGFITDKGKFLNRIEAEQHARKCGQLTKKTIVGGEVTSEDLW